MKKWRAFKEATADTVLGAAMNVPANFILVSIALNYGWTAATTTAVMTAWFTCMAIIRKMTVRLHFEKRHQEIDKSPRQAPK